MIKIQLKNPNRLIFLIKTKLRKPAWTQQLPINLNNNQNPVEIRVQNQSQSHEFDQKELKNLTKWTKIGSKSISKSQLRLAPGYKSK